MERRTGSLGDCFGEVTAVPSEELEQQEPVGLGGLGLRSARASWTSLKSNTLEVMMGADIGMGKAMSWQRSGLEPNTALERGELRLGFSAQGMPAKPSRLSKPAKGALSGGLALDRLKPGNWNILDVSEARRVKGLPVGEKTESTTGDRRAWYSVFSNSESILPPVRMAM